MNVQRSAFLMLAGAIAAQSCVIKEMEEEEGAGGAGAGGASDGAAGGNSGGTNGSVAGSGGTAAAGAAGTGATGAVGNAPAAGASGTAGSAGGPAGACDDTVGTPGDCAGLAAIPNCAAFSWNTAYCNAAKVNLKPRVAAAAVSCMLGFTDCNVGNAYTCVQQALGNACRDTTRDALSAEAVAICGDVNAVQCHALVDGLSDVGAANLWSCIEGGCTFGLWSCVEGLQ